MNGLTRRQGEALDFIRAYMGTHSGVSPSFDEIRDALGLKTRGRVHYLIKGLERRGHIRRPSAAARAIALVHRTHTCSACGNIDRVTQ